MGRWSIIPAVAIGQTTSLLLYSIAPDPTWFYPIRIFHALTLAAFGAVVAGVLSVIFNVQIIFRLAAIIVLSGVFAVNLTETRSETVI